MPFSTTYDSTCDFVLLGNLDLIYMLIPPSDRIDANCTVAASDIHFAYLIDLKYLLTSAFTAR